MLERKKYVTVILRFGYPYQGVWASLVAQRLKRLPAVQETWVLSPGEGNGNPLQYSCLENPMEGGAW